LGQSVAYSTDGRWLITGEFDSEGICVWNAITQEQVFEMGHDRNGNTWSAQLSPNRRHLVTSAWFTDSGRGITIWECDLGALESAESGDWAKMVKSFAGMAVNLSMAPDGRHFAFRGRTPWESGGLGLYYWDFSRDEEPHLFTTEISRGVQSIPFTPDSQKVVFLDANRFVVTFDVTKGHKVASFPTIATDKKGDWSPSVMLNLSPDGSTVALSSRSLRGVDLWNLESGRLLYTLPERSGTVYWLAWSPDNRRLAVARSNGEINIWNLSEVERVLSGLGLAP
jgi:WD40 repeat protein